MALETASSDFSPHELLAILGEYQAMSLPVLLNAHHEMEYHDPHNPLAEKVLLEDWKIDNSMDYAAWSFFNRILGSSTHSDEQIEESIAKRESEFPDTLDYYIAIHRKHSKRYQYKAKRFRELTGEIYAWGEDFCHVGQAQEAFWMSIDEFEKNVIESKEAADRLEAIKATLQPRLK